MPSQKDHASVDFERRVRDSFALQGAMTTLGAELTLVAEGAVDISMHWAAGLTQQHGFLHAGMVSTALDSAAGSPRYCWNQGVLSFSAADCSPNT